MTSFVKKRDGRKENFDVEKIKNVIGWSTESLDVNPLVLESKFDEFMKDDISTDDIQKNLIYHSRILCTPEEPEWSIVAGRLETMLRWKHTQIFEKSFHYYIQEQLDKGVYKHAGIKKWNKREIIELGEGIVQNRDLEHSYGSVLTATKKYLMTGECIQQMHMVNAMIIASVDSKETRLEFAKEIYEALSNRKLSLATPWLSNLRSSRNISSCFIIGVNDSMESIADNWKNAAMISKFGGGLGIDMSKIRAKGAVVNGVDFASKGTPSWTKVFNDIAVAVDQCFHPDTILMTRDGVKKISEITNNDYVLNESGDYSRVDRKKNYTQSTQMVEIKSKYSTHPERVTTAHPIIAIQNIKKGISFDRITQNKKDSYGFIDVGELSIDDFVGVKIPTNIESTTFDKDLCRFYGLMLGDGHITKKTNEYGIAFHSTNNEHSFEFVKEFLKKRNIHFWISNSSDTKCKHIRFSKTGENNENRARNKRGNFVKSNKLNLEEIQYEHLYNEDGHKRIHKSLLHIDPKLQLHIVKGLIESDGHIARNKEVTFYNTSDELVEGLRYILLRNKVLCSGEKITKKATEKVNVESECYTIRIPSIQCIVDVLGIPSTNKSHWFEHDGYLFNRIISIESYEYNGDVFDLGVTNFSSYQISSFMCHNGGKRAGAFTVHLPIWHRDIEDFLEIQSENGDFRKKAFDIFPQISLHDMFMREVLKPDGGTWYTFCPHEVKSKLNIELHGKYNKEFNTNYNLCVKAHKAGTLTNVGSYNAKDLVKIIMKTQIETGLPYLAFIDHINATNPNAHDGTIPCVNLCTESFSNLIADLYAHTCNLLSIVVGRVESDEEMIYLAGLGTHILDNGIALTSPPIKESRAHNERYRTIGIGIQGLHDYLAKNNLQWENTKAISKVAELIEYGCIKKSVELAESRGAYPAFSGSKWDTGEMIDGFKKHSTADLDWTALQECIFKNGIRNSQLTSPAPNTSTSIFMDAAAGVMPVYSAFFNEDNKTGKFSVYGMFLKEHPIAYERTQSRVDQKVLAKMIGGLQKFVDTGISAEYLFDLNDFEAKDLFELIITAWKEKTKAIYYIRSIKVGENIDAITGGESVCASCAG